MPDRPVRRSPRLKGYDYSSRGAYFVTICVERFECRLGVVEDGAMLLNDAGAAVEQAWLALAERFPTVELDEFVVMPNHVHGVVILGADTQCSGVRKPTLGEVMAAFKSVATNAYIHGVKSLDWPRLNKRLFQVRYYDHIIRNENDLDRIRQYIAFNPMRWDEDKNNPRNVNTPA